MGIPPYFPTQHNLKIITTALTAAVPRYRTPSKKEGDTRVLDVPWAVDPPIVLIARCGPGGSPATRDGDRSAGIGGAAGGAATRSLRCVGVALVWEHEGSRRRDVRSGISGGGGRSAVCRPDSARLLLSQAWDVCSRGLFRGDGRRPAPDRCPSVHRDAEATARVEWSACRSKHSAEMDSEDVSTPPSCHTAQGHTPPRSSTNRSPSPVVCTTVTASSLNRPAAVCPTPIITA